MIAETYLAYDILSESDAKWKPVKQQVCVVIVRKIYLKELV